MTRRLPRDPRELHGHWRAHQRHRTHPVDERLSGFVARAWSAEWDYPEPFRQKIVPMPGVHLTLRPGEEPLVVGPRTRHVVRELAGPGRVAGVAFRPAAFRPLAGGPLHLLVDVERAAAEVCGLRSGVDLDLRGLQDRLAELLPSDPGPAAHEAGRLVDLVAADRTVVRVERLAAVAGTSVRRVQRLFDEHVGPGPKWIIRRYRLQEVVARLESGEPVRWADLATELDYADQAHLVRDFSAVFGEPPTAYARRYPRA